MMLCFTKSDYFYLWLWGKLIINKRGYEIEQYEEIYPQEYELYSLNTSYSDIKNPSDMFNAFINREYKSRIKVKKILKAP